MTVEVATPLTRPAQRARPLPFTKRIRHGWAVEAAAAVAVFLVYDRIRDDLAGTSGVAFRNARQVVEIQQFMGIYHEWALQQVFLSLDWFMAFWNVSHWEGRSASTSHTGLP